MILPVKPYMALDELMPGQHIEYGLHCDGKKEYYVRCSEPIMKFHRNCCPQEWKSHCNPEYIWLDNPEYTKRSAFRKTRELIGNSIFYIIFSPIFLIFHFNDMWRNK